MRAKKKQCVVCKLTTYIWSKGRCKSCANKQDFKPLNRTPFKSKSVLKSKPIKRAPTKRHKLEKQLEREAQEIYWRSKANSEGEVYSENVVDGLSKFVGMIDECNYYCVCHIWSKGANTAMRCDQENFIILAPDEHDILDHFGGSSKLAVHQYIQNRIVYLKQKYNAKIS